MVKDHISEEEADDSSIKIKKKKKAGEFTPNEM